MYEVIRSGRKTLALEVRPDGCVLVRAPYRAAVRDIETFVTHHDDWIVRARARVAARAAAHPEPDAEREKTLRSRAKQELPARVSLYAQRMGVHPAGIRITSARTRFGSCSAKNSLCFSWRLMDYPEPAIDYVVVHELAHIVHKNHGAAFYKLIEHVLPDYRERRALLRN